MDFYYTSSCSGHHRRRSIMLDPLFARFFIIPSTFHNRFWSRFTSKSLFFSLLYLPPIGIMKGHRQPKYIYNNLPVLYSGWWCLTHRISGPMMPDSMFHSVCMLSDELVFFSPTHTRGLVPGISPDRHTIENMRVDSNNISYFQE